MSIAADLTSREEEIIRILKVLNSQVGGFVVVGGYAVNALGLHRFSVDCDLVTSERSLSGLKYSLEREGYRRKAGEERESSNTFRGARTIHYTKLVGGKPVSVDLFVDSLVCRQTGGRWSHRLIEANSVESNVAGVTGSTMSMVASRELLMAMKLHSGRDVDLRDIVMLSEGAEWESVARFAASGMREKVNRQVESAIAKARAKDFASALRAEFSIRSDGTPLTGRALKGLTSLRALLAQHDFKPSL